MMGIKIIIITMILGFFMILQSPAFAQIQTEQIQISLNHHNGDRVELSDVKIIIYKDSQKYDEIIGNSSLQFFKIQLPKDEHYKVEVFINEVFSGYQVFTVDKSKDLHIPISSSAGVQFNVFYDDGKTPIPNAKVLLKTKSGNIVTHGYTDMDGKALRFWIPSIVNHNDYYIPEIHLRDNLIFYPETIKPNEGSQNISITTKWPKSIEIIPISIYKNNSTKLSDIDGEFFASLYSNGVKISKSKLIRGDVRFTNIQVGEYELVISNGDHDYASIIHSQKIYLTNNNYEIKIIINKNTFTKPQVNQVNLINTENKIIEDFQAKHGWKLQSSVGIQKDDLFHFIRGDQSLSLETIGDGTPVFSRSPKYSTLDLSDKIITARLQVKNVDHVKEISFAFTDDEKLNWYVVKISPSDLVSGKWQDVTIDLSKGKIIGTPNIKLINKIQVRVSDDGFDKVDLLLNEISIQKIDEPANTVSESCNCVAFRLDDIQDFWLNDVQLKILETFKRNNIPLTIGIIGNSFGDDKKLVNYIKKELETQGKIEVANHGWKHEDFTLITYDEQLSLLQKTNKRISETLLKKPTMFIPPTNHYNNDTIKALREAGFTYFSSELDKSSPPYKFSDLEIYQFPETAVTGNLNYEETLFLKIDWNETLSQIEYSKQKYGFAVVTLHPQEFSVIKEGKHTNEPDDSQFSNLESLIQRVKASGTKITLISKINYESNDLEIPPWVKHNAGWWADGKIDDSSFVQGIQYMIKEKIMNIPLTSYGSSINSNQIPSWIKNNAKWWSDGLIEDNTFMKGIEFLVKDGIIQVS